MRKQKINESINFLEFVLKFATTHEDVEFCIMQLFKLNKLLSMVEG